MLPSKYRYYRLDGTRRIYEADWFVASDDDDALAQAKLRHPDEAGEVWIGPRLVAAVIPSVSPAQRSARAGSRRQISR